MDRDQAIKALKTICSRMAEKYGYTEMQVGEDRQKGIWGPVFTEFLEKGAGGDCSSEIRWFRPNDDYGYVEFRYRFDNPVIAIKFMDDEMVETLANLEFRTKRYVPNGVYEEDTNWHRKGDIKYDKVEVPCEISEVMLWNPKVSRSYADEMESMWNEING